ncbi:PAS domain-containing sensor histidine kinase [Ferriphaselus sp. R-1]|uniref:sensor histidine kinase n=1 Tax=Ferriphaselus sp. R-1 TaxID=1485544 RepID=UPI00068BAF14|nr:PAS domain-containing sensor histidine kinase [Ferriphaselus sp. R-1]
MPFLATPTLEYGIAPVQERLWRSLYFYAAYRLTLGGVFLFLLYPFSASLWLGSNDTPQFFRASLGYFLLTLLGLLTVRLRRPSFDVQLALLVGVDILGITLLADASGGITSGLNVLLLVSLAATGLVSHGPATLFYAALASIAVLLQHGYAVLTRGAVPELFMQVGLLCVAYFAVTWLAHLLARYAMQSEQLAMQRGMELAMMAEANRLLIHDLPDGVLMLDEHGGIHQANPSASRLLGTEVSTGGSLTESVPELARLHETWCLHPEQTTTALTVPGQAQTLRVRFLPVREDGFRGAVVVLEDTRRIQEQAQQFKLAALGRLTASIAHEVRNPLASISYAAELLSEEKRADSRNRLQQLILSNVARLNCLVQDIMQLNRRDRLHQENFDLSQQLPGLIREILQPTGTPAKTVSLKRAAHLPVRFDRGHLEQILWNLCSNALRHSRQQPGSVTLHAREEDGRILLDVSDDGPGIAPAVLPHLFEPFFTTDAAGTGLGLYISRELCEANGARLEHLPREEQGACFRITFGGSDEQ